MRTTPLPLRLEDDIQEILTEGFRRTPHKKQELIRITLRRYLRSVVEGEARVAKVPRLTSIKPWSNAALTRAYRNPDMERNRIESIATHAQAGPNLID